MKKLLLAATALAALAGPAHATDWLRIEYNDGGAPSSCERAKKSPAESFKTEKDSEAMAGYVGRGPRIIDNGDEVIVEIPPIAGLDMSEAFYRNEQACHLAIQAE